MLPVKTTAPQLTEALEEKVIRGMLKSLFSTGWGRSQLKAPLSTLSLRVKPTLWARVPSRSPVGRGQQGLVALDRCLLVTACCPPWAVPLSTGLLDSDRGHLAGDEDLEPAALSAATPKGAAVQAGEILFLTSQLQFRPWGTVLVCPHAAPTSYSSRRIRIRGAHFLPPATEDDVSLSLITAGLPPMCTPPPRILWAVALDRNPPLYRASSGPSPGAWGPWPFSKERHVMDRTPERLKKELEEELLLSSEDPRRRPHPPPGGKLPPQSLGVDTNPCPNSPVFRTGSEPTLSPAVVRRVSSDARAGEALRGSDSQLCPKPPPKPCKAPLLKAPSSPSTWLNSEANYCELNPALAASSDRVAGPPVCAQDSYVELLTAKQNGPQGARNSGTSYAILDDDGGMMAGQGLGGHCRHRGTRGRRTRARS
ncbi:hypothetical protein CB1_001428047 [Camelus ferus]|nr:hypothetical protein CB1_001428047 [Camelus ferus]